MKISNLLAAAGAVCILSAGAALAAADGCECCKDMAADAVTTCCDKMKPKPGPTGPASPAPAPAPSDAPVPQSHAAH